MIAPGWYAAFILLASGGVGCLVYAVADAVSHEWTAAHVASSGQTCTATA